MKSRRSPVARRTKPDRSRLPPSKRRTIRAIPRARSRPVRSKRSSTASKRRKIPMEETKPVKAGAGETLSPEQVTNVAGGDGSASATVGTSGINVTQPGPDTGAALVAIYEGFVDVTSHVIERVVNAVKNN